MRSVAGRLSTSAAPLATALLLSGCLGPRVLNSGLIAYDRNHLDAETRLLMLNIARLSVEMPAHVTTLSSISASYEFDSTVMGQAQWFPEMDVKNMYQLVLGGAANEKPTLTLAPIQGADFYSRFESPLVDKFILLISKGAGANTLKLLRLMAAAFYATDYGTLEKAHRCEPDAASKQAWLPNIPPQPGDFSDPNELTKAQCRYQLFRRVVMHFAYLAHIGDLQLQRLDYYSIPEDAPKVAAAQLDSKDIADAAKSGLRWLRAGDSRILGQFTQGVPAFINMDVHDRRLTETYKKAVAEFVQPSPQDWVYVDVRPDEVNDWEIKGYFQIRGLLQILHFLGKTTTAAYREPVVAPDPRTGALGSAGEMPATLQIEVGPEPRGDARYAIRFGSNYYWIRWGTDPAAQWNNEMFLLLYQLFEMSLVDTSKALATPPAVTISK